MLGAVRPKPFGTAGVSGACVRACVRVRVGMRVYRSLVCVAVAIARNAATLKLAGMIVIGGVSGFLVRACVKCMAISMCDCYCRCHGTRRLMSWSADVAATRAFAFPWCAMMRVWCMRVSCCAVPLLFVVPGLHSGDR